MKGNRQSSMSSSTAMPSCAKCQKIESDVDNPILKPCNTCKSVWYCSRVCKKADWKAHKSVCSSQAQEYMKTVDMKMATRAPPKAQDHDKGYKKWQFDT